MHMLPLILFALLFISCLTGFVLQLVFLSRLRTRHPQTWEELGRPGLFHSNPGNVLAVLRFLWRRDYLALGDESFAKFVDFLRGYMVAYFIFLTLYIVVIFINPGGHH